MKPIKPIASLFRLFGVAMLFLLAGGCASTQQTEDLLSAAGFKMVPATTPQQQAHLKTLPPDKITAVPRNGTEYFVYPDVAKQVLYVGQQLEYQEYQQLRLKNQLAQDQVAAAEMSSEPGFNAWGEWGGPVPVRVFRR